MKRNCVFAALAALILWSVGREALAQPVRVPDDAVAFVQLESGQYLSNFGERITRTKFLRVHGKPGAKAGLVVNRPTAVDPLGQTVNLSLHGFAMNGWLFTGEFDVAAIYNAGVEEGTYSNVVVDAKCGVAKCLFTTVDLWGIGGPHGPTLSGGNIVSMRLYGPNSIGFLGVGEVTDTLFGQLSISGTGSARIQAHSVPPYQWNQWNSPTRPTSEGMPKRLLVQDARMAEGSYTTGIVYSVQRPGLTQPPTVEVQHGGPFPYQTKVQMLGTLGGPTDPPPTTQPVTSGLVPMPTWDLWKSKDDGFIDPPANMFVDNTNANATDSNNPRGTMDRPRRSIPYRMSAGDVLEIRGGPYVGSNLEFLATGTKAMPIVIRGVGKPRIEFKWSVFSRVAKSEWVRFEGIRFYKWEVMSGASNIVARDCEMNYGGGINIAGSETLGSIDNVVIDNCIIHNNGNWLAAIDQDIHGISITARVSYVWVMDSVLYHNSGDAIQINAGSLADQSTSHHVYVVGNEMYENKQTGGVSKQARHVVFAGNYVHDHRPIGTSPSAWGAGLGHQYGAGPIWFVANRIDKCSFGIQSGSTSGLGDGQDAYYLFNTTDNIRHDPAYAYNPGTAWSNAGLALVGNPNKYVIGNTIRNADGGIYFPGGSRILVEGNVLADVLNYDVWLEDIVNNQQFNVFSNLAWPTAELRKANQPQAWPIGNIVADPATAGRTWIPSPECERILDLYKAEFGVDLRQLKGTAPWKIGAAE